MGYVKKKIVSKTTNKCEITSTVFITYMLFLTAYKKEFGCSLQKVIIVKYARQPISPRTVSPNKIANYHTLMNFTKKRQKIKQEGSTQPLKVEHKYKFYH